LCYSEEKLYIADTENHLIRYANLKEKTVLTIVGTGTQGFDFKGGKKGIKQSISSPWDLALKNGILYIAMAGSHQIWTYDLAADIAANFSGTGQELHLNSEEPLSAAWAQPSGLSLGNDILYVADSESSSIRCIDLKSGKTETLAGADPNEPRNLFCFGDQVGLAKQALFQHPLAVLWLDKSKELLIADTYNHQIKSLKNGFVENFARDGLNEPSGLCFSEKKNLVFVADTNNHRIRLIDAKNKSISTLEIS
jgi:DNA-binding beta-propeller fold protein YncE